MYNCACICNDIIIISQQLGLSQWSLFHNFSLSSTNINEKQEAGVHYLVLGREERIAQELFWGSKPSFWRATKRREKWKHRKRVYSPQSTIKNHSAAPINSCYLITVREAKYWWIERNKLLSPIYIISRELSVQSCAMEDSDGGHQERRPQQLPQQHYLQQHQQASQEQQLGDRLHQQPPPGIQIQQSIPWVSQQQQQWTKSRASSHHC